MRRVLDLSVGEDTERGSGVGRVIEGSGDRRGKDRGFWGAGKGRQEGLNLNFNLKKSVPASTSSPTANV